MKITPEIELDAGLRYTHETKNYTTVFDYVTPTFRARYAPEHKVLSSKLSEDNFSPQVTLTWRPNSDITLYGGYKTGYKSGGFNATAFPGPNASNVDEFRFGNETVDGFEVGAKILLDDGRLSINSAIYSYDYKGLQVNVYDALTTTFNARNAGLLRTKGAEIDVAWRADTITDGLHLRGAIAYNHARYQDYSGPCYAGQTPAAGCNLSFANNRFNEQLYSGRQPPKAPAWAGSAGALYDVKLAGGNQLSLSGDARYTSKYNSHDALRPDMVQKAYWLFDSVVRFEHHKGWAISLIGRNLGNEIVNQESSDKGQTGSGTGTDAGLMSDTRGIVSTGREVIVEFSVHF